MPRQSRLGTQANWATVSIRASLSGGIGGPQDAGDYAPFPGFVGIGDTPRGHSQWQAGGSSESGPGLRWPAARLIRRKVAH